MSLHTARWQHDGTCERWSFVLKRASDTGAAEHEARVLQWVRPLGLLTTPTVLGANEHRLLLTRVVGTPLSGESHLWWRQTVRSLAQFHTRARPLVQRLPQDRRLRWPVVVARVQRLVETVAKEGPRLSPGHQAVQAGLAVAWDRKRPRLQQRRHTTLVHGDLRPDRVLVPQQRGEGIGLVGWEHAGEHVPTRDLVTLLTDLPAAIASRLLDDYAQARTAAGWACPRGLLSDEYSALACLRRMEQLAGALLQPIPPPVADLEAVLGALERTDEI